MRCNRQYISLGNLSENPKVLLFLMDYAHRQRVKVWGAAKVVEDDRALIAKLTTKSERADQAIVITVTAWDGNCPRYIPQLLPAATVAGALEQRDRRIAELEARLAALKPHPAEAGTGRARVTTLESRAATTRPS